MVERQILINQRQVESRKTYHFAKWVFDIVMSALGLAFLSPVMAVIAYRIKHEDGARLSISRSELVKMVKDLRCISSVQW